ncbi:tetratricopeptide repeat protein [Thiorhodovibrio frisius]|uniref:protein O-GlcNAc transferase n=1 Tax=Thiorhodovibrio frisius TaxID=631362 RepID=H8Z5A8_9GAMM|nr:tetratricopeptide repeat protein [Thiorhodovibrio frisius]EIC20515.1 putative O-linked N-acetylglucosamine transferase, SPINDLY family [Thiorhodovibrio frisius]WPL21259.1 TPR repeat-containing protein YrrB [Thiorhodovibrio frisius]
MVLADAGLPVAVVPESAEGHGAVIDTKNQPAGAQAHALGLEQLALGKLPLAMVLFEQAVSEDPGALAYWLSLIEIQLNLKGAKAALDVVNRAIAAVGEGHDGLKRLRAALAEVATVADRPAWEEDLHALARVFESGEMQPAFEQAEQFTARWPEVAAGWSLLARCRQSLRDRQGAVAAMARAVTLEPGNARWLTNLGVMQKSAGLLADARLNLCKAIAINPHLPEAHLALAGTARAQGRLEEAEASYRRALELRGDQAEAHHNLGNLLEQLGRLDEAEASFCRALSLKPTLAVAVCNLVTLLTGQGRHDEAEEALTTALASQPDEAALHFHLGRLLLARGRPEAATGAYAEALRLQPDHAEACLALAELALDQGHLGQAEYHYRQALERWPDRADILEPVAGFLAGIDALEEAMTVFRRALQLNPDRAELWFLSANVAEVAGQLDLAEEHYRQALKRNANDASAWTHLGELLRNLNRREEALEAHARALEIDPALAVAQQNLGMLLTDLTRFEEAVAAFREAIRWQPKFALAMSNMLFTMGFAVHWPGKTMRHEASRWEQVALSPQDRHMASARLFSNPSRIGRPLKLGVISSELGNHAVAYFLKPWLRAMERRRCTVHLYPTRLRSGPWADSFKSLADAWTPVVGLNDRQIAERIRADGIDVLIETSGHTSNHRLAAVAHRAAPVQCHYIGYFATTGLTEMDYFIGDSVFTPPWLHADFTEELWALPRSRYAFEPLAEAPAPSWCPDPAGRLWLASFNQFAKVREESLELWSEILRAVPQAHLFLKDKKAADPMVRERILGTLARHGIHADRVKMASRTNSWSDHMGLYNYVDLALDPTPFTSATTGFDALWMGTPLVTLLGDQPAGRQAASLLTGLGRTDWIACTQEDYVRIALDLLDDVQQRQRLRFSLRERMQAGELCDGAGLAATLLEAFESMFDRWYQRAEKSGDQGAL